ncbi:MAG: hypothetical protein JSW58_02025 [Candidatus Latescibacterota bacterium]|nr:MAG: hypothetical protein JSW58_02025 [Candidatus Latescibacterota bacterium]
MKIDRREIARDLMGLGSVPFLLLVVVRVAMVGNFLELFHIVTAVVLFGLISIRLRGLHFHSGRIVIMAIFTSVFYDDRYYTTFALLIALVAIFSFVRYLKIQKVYTSLVLGLICSLVSYLVSLPLDLRNI